MYIHLEKLAKTIHSSTFLRSLSLTGQSQLQQQLSPIFLQIQHLVTHISHLHDAKKTSGRLT